VPEFVFQFFNLLLNVLSIAIIGRALLSWFDPGGRNAISRVLGDITDPILAPIRRLMPQGMMIDFSPLIAILVIQFLQRLLVSARY
jgi:YggT family protein